MGHTDLEGHRDNIQNNDLDSSLCKQLHDLPTDPTGSTGDQDNFLVPIILVFFPVVQRAVIQVVGSEAKKAKGEKEFNSAKGGSMEDGEVGAFLGVASCEYEKQRDSWIQRSLLDKAPDRVSCQA
jgi:hypothetical protein